MRIVGVSFDAPEKNAAWAETKGFSFELWTDTARELALHYGAASSADQKRARRITRVLDAQGALVLEYKVGLGVATHPGDVLQDLQILEMAGAPVP